jgi:hypothetical protein
MRKTIDWLLPAATGKELPVKALRKNFATHLIKNNFRFEYFFWQPHAPVPESGKGMPVHCMTCERLDLLQDGTVCPHLSSFVLVCPRLS